MRSASAKKPRRRLLRPRVSAAEKGLCLLLLALVPVAAGAVYRKGQHYDPGLYALDPALVQATRRRAQALGAASADPGEDAAGMAASAAPSAAAPAMPPGAGFAVPGLPPSGLAATGLVPLLPGLPPGVNAPTPPGAPLTTHHSPLTPATAVLPASFGDPAWAASGRVERFNPDNLYEKINGKAEFYLKYGAAGLQTVGYADRRSPGRFLDAFVYDMTDSRNAFGIFSNERPKGAQPAPLGEQGYTADGSCFFIRGKHYVQVVASERSPAVQQASLKLARATDAALGGAQAMAPTAAAASPAPAPAAAPKPAPAAKPGSARPAAVKPAPASTARPAAAPPGPDFDSPAVMLSLFPGEDAVANASEYLKQDAFGQQFMSDVYSTRYQHAGKDYVLFLAKRPDARDARSWMEQYSTFLGQLGKLLDRRVEGEMEFACGEMGGSFDVVFQVGPFFGGANGAPDREVAQELCVRLIHSVAGRAPKLVPPKAGTLKQWPSGEPTDDTDDGS